MKFSEQLGPAMNSAEEESNLSRWTGKDSRSEP